MSMKNVRLAGFLLIAALSAAGKAHSMPATDWWGPVSAEITVHVLSADSREPIEGASVRLSSLDVPAPRKYATGDATEGITDSSGFAVIRAQFDAEGSSRTTAPWQLRGTLEVSREGYRTSRGPLDGLYTAIVRGTPVGGETGAIELEIFLKPAGAEADVVPAPLVPIGFSASAGGYVFNGQTYRIDPFIMGVPSLVDAIAAGPMDETLTQLVKDYQKKVAVNRALFWGGFAVLLAGGTVEVIFGVKENRSPSDTTIAIISGCVGIAGGVATFVGMFGPGFPVDVVAYYNRTYP